MPTSTITQKELAKLMSGGDQSCLSVLYQRYGAMLYGILLRQHQSPQLAGKILLRTFMAAIGGHPVSMKEPNNLFCHLLKIALNISKSQTMTNPTINTVNTFIQSEFGLESFLRGNTISNNNIDQQELGLNLRKEIKKFRTE